MQDITALKVTSDEEVVACEASHWTPVYYPVCPLGVVPQVGGCQMLYGVQGTLVQSRLAVGCLHADVECRYHIVAYVVLAANVDARQQAQVVNGEARYFFHILFFEIKFWRRKYYKLYGTGSTIILRESLL